MKKPVWEEVNNNMDPNHLSSTYGVCVCVCVCACVVDFCLPVRVVESNLLHYNKAYEMQYSGSECR